MNPLSLLSRAWRVAHARWNRSEAADWHAVFASLLGGIVLAPLVNLLPMPGFDWGARFYTGDILFSTPWVNAVVAPFRLLEWRPALAVLNGITLMTVAVATSKAAGHRRNQLWAVPLALFSPPVIMVLWDGQLDGLALLGLIGLPWLVPLALVRPHLAMWPILSRRNWTLASILFGVLSLLVWGWWPAVVMGGMPYMLDHPISMGWSNLGWPVGLLGFVLILLSRGDLYRLLAAGSLASPYVMPYHYLILMPALGRVGGPRRFLLWACAWLTLLVPAVAAPGVPNRPTAAHYLALIFPLAVWLVLGRSRRDAAWLKAVPPESDPYLSCSPPAA